MQETKQKKNSIVPLNFIFLYVQQYVQETGRSSFKLKLDSNFGRNFNYTIRIEKVLMAISKYTNLH